MTPPLRRASLLHPPGPAVFRKGGVVPLRPWQLVPGTQFVVDRFDSLPPSLPQHRHWFLTHFHADHYKGLTGK